VSPDAGTSPLFLFLLQLLVLRMPIHPLLVGLLGYRHWVEASFFAYA